MRRSFDDDHNDGVVLSFASSNEHKYGEVHEILGMHGIRTHHAKLELVEIQSCILAKIAKAKARDAFSKIGRPVLVEDDGLFIDCLDGFPGPYSAYVLDTIGTAGILQLLQGSRDRRARFVSAIAYDDGATRQTFGATLYGVIHDKPLGTGWGYDPVFVPRGCGATFAEMTISEKSRVSHRRIALDNFCFWYKENLASA